MFKKYFQKDSGIELEQETIKKIQKKKIPNLRQLTYLPKFLTSEEKRKIKISFFFFSTSLILLLIFFYFFHLEIIPAVGGEYREGIVGEANLTRLVYSGLLKYESDLTLKEDLASTFKIKPDKKSVQFCLRDAFWHPDPDQNRGSDKGRDKGRNDKKVTIDDVIFTFNLAKEKKLENFIDLNIKKITPNCLEVSSEKSFEGRLSIFTLSIEPADGTKLSGTGPFKIVRPESDPESDMGSEKEEKSYLLKRNEKYYGEKPFIEKITLKIYPDLKSAFDALAKREIDALGFTPPQEIFKPQEFPELNIYSFPLPSFTAIFFNLKKESSLIKSREIRQTLSYLTPKDKILKEALAEEGKIIDGSNYNSEEAKKILSTISGSAEISLTIIEDPIFQKVADLLVKEWQNFGIETNLVIIKPSEVKKVISKKNFEAIILTVLTKFEADPYPLWHSSQIESGSNISGFNNRKADELLEKYKLTTDEKKKKEYIDEFQEILSKEMPAISLYSINYNYLINKKVKGVNIEKINYPEDRFNEIEKWYIKTKKVRPKSDLGSDLGSEK